MSTQARVGSLRHYLRVYRAAMATCMAREMQYRGHFLLLGISNLAWTLLSVAQVLILFSNVHAVAGWDVDRMLVLTGTAQLVTGVTSLLFETNMGKLSEYVNKGELDFVLLKPMDSQFLASTRYLNVNQLPAVVASLATLAVGWARLGLHPSAWGVAAYALLVLSAICAFYALWFASVTFVLWTGRIDNIQFLIMPVMEMARVPADVFRGLARPLLTFVIPVALIATLPSQALLGLLDPWTAAYSVALAALLLWLSHRFWRHSLRRYSSASS
jgi:ABC-2 type transport system permease protein